MQPAQKRLEKTRNRYNQAKVRDFGGSTGRASSRQPRSCARRLKEGCNVIWHGPFPERQRFIKVQGCNCHGEHCTPELMVAAPGAGLGSGVLELVSLHVLIPKPQLCLAGSMPQLDVNKSSSFSPPLARQMPPRALLCGTGASQCTPSNTRNYHKRMCKLVELCPPARCDGRWTGSSSAAPTAASVPRHGPSNANSAWKYACAFVLAPVRLQSPKSGPEFSINPGKVETSTLD